MSRNIILATVSAPTNIAVIKYWGKASVEYNTPINSSLSVTLEQADLRAVTTVAASPGFIKDRLWLNGEEEENAATSKRFRSCVDGVKALARDKVDASGAVLATKADLQQWKVHVSSYNTFPTAAGLASSAAGYAALVAALSELMGAIEEYPGQLTTLARQGSGSACRSLYGGLVAWRMGSAAADWTDSIGQQVAPESHWPDLRALICVVSDQKKDTSSTAGMGTAVATSKLLKYRAESVVPQRMKEMESSILARDFSTFGKLTMQDSNQFHATCLDSYPPIFYMNDISRSIIRLITVYNAFYSPDGTSLRAAYTFDAGPNAVVYCLEEHATELAALMLHYFPAPPDMPKYMNNTSFYSTCREFELDTKLIQACDATGRTPKANDVKQMYYTRSGPGPQVLDALKDGTLDPTTGLNTYIPPQK